MKMTINNAVVAEVSTKPVKTRFGEKDTYSFKAGGTWYKTGFKNHGLSVGMVVSFEAETGGKYGAEVDVATISVNTGHASSIPTPPVREKQKEFKNGSFPIDPLDGQRSIIRQNAITNAREIVALSGSVGLTVGTPTLDQLVDLVIQTAKRIEAYTSGDDDMAAVKKSLTEE